jgi:DNA-binding transcriptional ArsR family regulator
LHNRQVELPHQEPKEVVPVASSTPGPRVAAGAEPPEDSLSELFAALADPTRRAILTRLARGEATVNELAEPFEITFQAVSKHLKVLERAGLVARSRQAQYRPVRLEPSGFDPAARWLAEHREMRLAQLDRLEHTIHALRGAAPPPPAAPAGRPGAGPTQPEQ